MHVENELNINILIYHSKFVLTFYERNLVTYSCDCQQERKSCDRFNQVQNNLFRKLNTELRVEQLDLNEAIKNKHIFMTENEYYFQKIL